MRVPQERVAGVVANPTNDKDIAAAAGPASTAAVAAGAAASATVTATTALTERHRATYLENRALLILLVAVSIAFAWILLPFYGTIMWGSIIALLFAPVYRRLLKRMHGRRTGAALLTLLLVLVIVILPAALVAASLGREVGVVYQRIQSGELNPTVFFERMFASLPSFVTTLLERFGLADFAALQRRLGAVMTQGSQIIAKEALNIGQNTFDFVVSLFITLYLAFFLIRDGEAVLGSVRRAIPLKPQHKQELLGKFTTVIRATVKGNLLVAAVQGALGGIAFAFIGIGAPMLWAVLMAFFSLLPAIGAALVWLPVALYLFMTGEVASGIGLTLFGTLVIGLVDNLLRPVLVGKDTRMPDYLVLVTTLGGIAVFGINGFVIGPAIAAMFIAVWHLYGLSRNAPPPQAPPPPR